MSWEYDHIHREFESLNRWILCDLEEFYQMHGNGD